MKAWRLTAAQRPQFSRQARPGLCVSLGGLVLNETTELLPDLCLLEQKRRGPDNPPAAAAKLVVEISDTTLDRDAHEKLAVPAFITVLVMPLAFSISEGLAMGILAYVVLKLGTGQARRVGAVTYVLAGLFLLHFLFGR